MPDILIEIQDGEITEAIVQNGVAFDILVQSGGAVGPQGPKGDKGDKGDTGDPATNLVQSVAGKTGIVTLVKSDVGLSNVDNTADASKPISTLTQTALDSKADLVGGKVPSAQLPAYVDDVLEYANFAALPATGTAGVIYITLDTNLEYRWSGSAYVNIAKGDVQSVNGYTGVITLAKSDLGLGNVDNTSDVNKPVSTAQQTALNLKANTSSLATVATSGAYNDLSGKPTIPTNNNQLTNGAGYITAYDDPMINLLQAKVGQATNFTGQTIGVNITDAINSSSLTSGQIRYTAVKVKAGPINGIYVIMSAQGSYTANNNNRVNINTLSGGALTERASCADNGNLWKATSNSLLQIPFTTPYVLAQDDVLWVGIIYCSSAQTTAPALAAKTTLTSTILSALNLSNSVKWTGTLNSQTNLPSSQAMSAVQQINLQTIIWTY